MTIKQKDTSKRKKYIIEIAVKEFIYHYFKKKRCPKCNNRLIKTKGYKTIPSEGTDIKSSNTFVNKNILKRYHYFFLCKKCGSRFLMKELVDH